MTSRVEAYIYLERELAKVRERLGIVPQRGDPLFAEELDWLERMEVIYEKLTPEEKQELMARPPETPPTPSGMHKVLKEPQPPSAGS